jgi:hypothetical protein
MHIISFILWSTQNVFINIILKNYLVLSNYQYDTNKLIPLLTKSQLRLNHALTHNKIRCPTVPPSILLKLYATCYTDFIFKKLMAFYIL